MLIGLGNFCHLSDPDNQDLALFQDVFFFPFFNAIEYLFMYAQINFSNIQP